MSIDSLLEALSPATLRERFQVPYDNWREEFEPRFLTTDSYPAMMAELGRFVGHMLSKWFGGRVPWWPEHAESTAQRLLNEKLGDGMHARSGEFAAMQVCRFGDRGGMRFLLDELAKALLAKALGHYLDIVVLMEIQHLSFDEQMELARAYQSRFAGFRADELDSPAGLLLRWRQVIFSHAWQALHG